MGLDEIVSLMNGKRGESMRIPREGMEKETLFKIMRSFREKDAPWKTGRTWGYVYDPGEKAMAVGKEAYTMFLTENALDPTVYPSLIRFENELVSMAAGHVDGDEQVVGNFTSGGTESILLAVKTARDYFRAKHPRVRHPEMILPETGHAAFHKACAYFDIKRVQVPVDKKTFKVDAKTMEHAVTPNTIMLVGSAPSYAHGVIDPIADIGDVALKNNLLFHVDACVGGFMLPYFRRLGTPIPPFGFSVPGVTSLSMDLHKYAYTPKGASIILYRNKALRRFQIFSCASWPGYTVVNNTAQSSKSGGPMAAAWAVLNFMGDEGYLEMARQTRKATQKLVEGIKRIEGLRLLAEPEMCMVAFTSDGASVFSMIDLMTQRGWCIQAQFAYGESRENIHLSVNASNIPWVEDFLGDLEDCVAEAKGLKSSDTPAEIARQFSGVAPEEITDDVLSHMLSLAGLTETGVLPVQTAEINETLNALPAPIRERLLTLFFNDLFIYRKGEA